MLCGTRNNRRKQKNESQNHNVPQKMNPKMNGKTGNKPHHPTDSKSHSKSLSASVSNNVKTGDDMDDIRGHGLSPNPYKWTEDEVSQWIKHIGYAQYMELFTQEHVNGEALLALTKDEFGQLGIYALGHTKNILNKIQLLQKSAAKYKPRDPFNETDFKSPYTFDQRDYWASHPEAYSQDKQRDKNTYWELWAKIVSHRDFMLEHDYRKLMSRSGLAKHDIDMIWKLSTSSNHGRCSFDEFTSIMKLSHLAQSRIPLYIVNVSKLIFYHPPLASVEFFEFSSIFSDLQKQQVLQNMVGFYNLPSSILDSDDRLMELEKKALRPYHPIHFEINAKVLIATFSSTISDKSIRELQKSVLMVLREQMASSQHSLSVLDKVYVERPSPKELGMTPAGPPQQKDIYSNGQYGAPPYNGVGAPYGQQQQQQQQHSPQHVHPPPPIEKLNIQQMQQILICEDFWEQFRVRSDIDKIIVSSEDKIRTRQAMQLISKLRDISLKSVKFTDEGVKLIANKTKYELMDDLSKNNVHLKATILGLSEMDIPHPIPHTMQHTNDRIYPRGNDMMGGTSPTEELYKGIVIEGLPDVITNDDENIRKLDSAVLNEFIVSHIEVVDNVLRITFANQVTHKNINQLRKYLKSFLKDDIKLDKKSMKNVSIIPHTIQTWKGETTERSVEVHNTNQYIHVGIDSMTNTPQQQAMNQNNLNAQYPFNHPQQHYYNH
eukprot:184636_1